MLAAALSIPDPRERPDRPRGGRAPEARPVRRRALRLHLLPEPVALPRASNEKNGPATRFGGCAARSSCTTCASANGRTSPGSCAASPATSASRSPTTGARRPGARARGAAGGPAVTHRAARGRLARLTRARATRSSSSRPARCSPSGRRAGSSSPTSSRPAGSTAASRRASSRRPSSGSRAIWSQRTYSEPHWDAERGAVMAYERVTLYGLPLVAAPPRRLRAGRPDGRPGSVHPARARRGRLADPAPLLPRQRPAA